jgi:hypothetical protein
MTVSRGTVVGLGAVAALGLALLVRTAPPERHLDGAGPLASLNGPGSEMMATDPSAAGHPTSWTFGLRLCLASGTDPAVIESVAPTVSIGTGYRFLGAGIRQFQLTRDHTTVIGLSAWPPPRTEVPDTLADVRGYVVSTPCSEPANSGAYTELMIGLGREGDDGGGWNGIDVGYSVAGRHRVLVIAHDLFICGPAVAEQCGLRSSQVP